VQLAALGAGLYSKEGETQALLVHRRLATAVRAALRRRRTHLQMVASHADKCLALKPDDAVHVSQRTAALAELSAFGTATCRVMSSLGMVGGGGVDDDNYDHIATTAGLLNGPWTGERAMTLRVIGPDAAALPAPMQVSQL
jgi:hypothetical protein